MLDFLGKRTKDLLLRRSKKILCFRNFKVSLGFFLMNNHISKNIFPLYSLYIPFC